MAETVTFYELPPDRFDEVRQAAMGMWRARRALDAILASLRQPRAPYHQTTEFYFSAAIGVVGDAPLRSGEEMFGDDSERCSDLMMDLNEGVGGMWEVIEPSPERLAALDPDTFDVERLHAHYRGVDYYYPDPEDDEDDADDEDREPDGLIDSLVFSAIDTLEKLASDDPEDYPAEAGEEIQRSIGVLREALAATANGAVLLIRN